MKKLRRGFANLEVLIALGTGLLSVLNHYIFPIVGAAAINVAIEVERRRDMGDEYKPQSILWFLFIVMFGAFLAYTLTEIGVDYGLFKPTTSRFIGGIMGAISPHIINFITNKENFKALFSRIVGGIKK